MVQALENLENVHFNGLLLNKAYNTWAKKSTENWCLMALIIDSKFEGKLTCAFKNDMRNLTSFNQSTIESLKIEALMGSFYPKQKMHELNIYRWVMCHHNREWWKMWRGIDLSVQKWHEEFDEFWPEQKFEV